MSSQRAPDPRSDRQSSPAASPAAGGSAAPTETAWVERARNGDVGAFEELYRAHVGRIHATVLRMVGDPGRAEDLTQDAFIRAWKRLDSFRGDSGFGTWLHRLAVNLVLMDLRRRGRWHLESLDAATADPLPPEIRRPPAAVPASIDLERALAALPPRARTVFVLHDVEGYRHREIAELTGLAVGTSKSHLSQARRRLQEELAR